MIGLPDSVRACLFDLDGVLTRTAAVHAAALHEHGASMVVSDLSDLLGDR